jgi:hypothetical protein
LLLTKRHPATMHEAPYVATAWAQNFTGVAHGDD